MITQDFIISFCQMDDDMTDVLKRADAKLYPIEGWPWCCYLPSKALATVPYIAD